TFDAYANLYAGRIGDTVANKQYRLAEDYVGKLFKGPPVFRSLKSDDPAVTRAGKEAASGLIETLSGLDQHSLAIAQRRVAALRKNLTLVPDFPSEGIRLLSSLESKLSSAAEHQESLDSLLSEKARLVSDRAAALTQFDLLAKDTSELFSLSPASVTTQGQSP